MDAVQDKVYQDNLKVTQRLVAELKENGVNVDCYSCRGTNGSSGSATDDCDIAIDFDSSDRDAVAGTMKPSTLKWHVAEIPDYVDGISRLKIDL